MAASKQVTHSPIARPAFTATITQSLSSQLASRAARQSEYESPEISEKREEGIEGKKKRAPDSHKTS